MKQWLGAQLNLMRNLCGKYESDLNHRFHARAADSNHFQDGHQAAILDFQNGKTVVRCTTRPSDKVMYNVKKLICTSVFIQW